MVDLDRVDRAILKLLQEDSKMTLKELNEKLSRVKKLTVPGVKRRIDKLIPQIIKKYSIVIDPNKARVLSALVLVKVTYPNPDFNQFELARQIAGIENVSSVYIVTGTWDMVVHVLGENQIDISTTVLRKIRSLVGVERTETEMVLHVTKENGVILPVNS